MLESTHAPLSTWNWDAPALAARADSTAFARLWRAFMGARIVVAMVLVAVLGVLRLLGLLRGGGWELALAFAYLAAAVIARVRAHPSAPGRTFDRQWVFTIGIDLLAFSALNLLERAGLNYSPLYALPVLTASVMGSSLLALGTAAAVTLLLLTDAWVQALQLPADYAPRFVQAGLAGGGYFAVALLANQLAGRLAREEQAALRGRSLARTQAYVNELVIETLAEGVLVVGSDQRIHAANPAARQLLGWRSKEAPASLLLASRPGWRPLAAVAQRTFHERAPQSAELSLELDPGESLHLGARTRLTPPHDLNAESLCVIFLQDLREAEARLRTEKLAAMGRMSAAVAHEIRNPLAAIAQANALLEEELAEPAQRQLSGLVRTNAQRLAQIVDDILNVAQVQRQIPSTEWLRLDAEVRQAAGEWRAQAQAGERVALHLRAPAGAVAFEPAHLRRVLVNLLDNAARHASAQPGAIQVATSLEGEHALLRVWSDGAAVPLQVQRHLFEPFFSSESRSSGLGLYICRELCNRHGATIAYRRASAPDGSARGGNDFFVQLRTRAAAGV